MILIVNIKLIFIPVGNFKEVYKLIIKYVSVFSGKFQQQTNYISYLIQNQILKYARRM